MSTGTPDDARVPNIISTDISDEMRTSYLTYAMSVIISRAIPDVRDGLKPSQRRLMVAMHDLRLGPNTGRIKCSKIAADASGNYHPHGSESLYLTLVRLGQNWMMREILVDKQGNFGSLAGLPPAASRYTEARMSGFASEMLDDIDKDTVDYVLTYDQRMREPVVLPSRVPNLVVNGSTGIAVGMATSIPPHNLAETCRAIILLIDEPDAGLDDIVELLPAPDFPTGGIICGRMGVRQGYLTGRSTLTLRARTSFEEEGNHDVIVVSEIPFMETRDQIREKLEQLVRDERVKGIARVTDLTDRTLPPWQVRLHIDLKRDADKEVVLKQLLQYSTLQKTISINLLSLVANRPQLLSIKQLLQEFIRHRTSVLRRRTEHQLAESRKRKHTVEGLLIAQLNIDEVISTIRSSPSRSEAKERLQTLQVPGELIARALQESGFDSFQEEHGVRDTYSLSPAQADAIVAMQLGSLAGLERDELGGEFRKLLESITEYLRLLSDESNLLALIRAEMEELIKKYPDQRRTSIDDEELTYVDRADLITEEPMVVTLSHRGYIKRMSLDTYSAQGRGGKGVIGARADDEDPIEHLFVASTHDYLLFFSDRGKVFWQKVYDLPLLNRTSKGRALVNLVPLQEGEKICNCLAVRDFDSVRQLLMATRKGIVKKTALSAYGRPLKGGIIAIKLDDDDALIDVVIVSPEEDVLLATAKGMAIRFAQVQARSMGRNTRGVKGINLSAGDHLVGMVVAKPELDLLTVCEKGYGKRTPFGALAPPSAEELAVTDEDGEIGAEASEVDAPGGEPAESAAEVELPEDAAESGEEEAVAEGEDAARSNMFYRRQKRGGKGVRDIQTSDRNGAVVDVSGVSEDDEVLMVTANGKIQRVRVKEIRRIGRNTQGVRIIRLDEGDSLVSIACVPNDETAVASVVSP